MTATAVFVSEEPPLVTVSVAKHIVTHDLIDKSGEFVVNVASTGQAQLARQLGSIHGGDVDKFEKFGVATEPAQKVAAPIIQGSYASLECKVITSFTASTYAVYLAEVVAHRSNAELVPMVWQNDKFFSVREPVS
jgi:flavin reductase (DIM6/NTAB) family NADH-FMN oxidoreductase RutF